MVGVGKRKSREREDQRHKGGKEKVDKGCASLGMAGRFPALFGWHWTPYWCYSSLIVRGGGPGYLEVSEFRTSYQSKRRL